MTLTLGAILILVAAAALYAAVIPPRARGWLLLVASVVAVYVLQPPLPIRFSDTILPTVTLALAVLSWWVTRKREDPVQQATWVQDRLTLGLVAAIVLGLSLTRYLSPGWRILTASKPPEPWAVALGLAGVAALLAALRGADQRKIAGVAIGAMVALFVMLKTGPLAAGVAQAWRGLTGQNVALGSAADLNWLGFSYVAFRLIHTMRDRQTGQLPPLSLREYLTYAIFFPALVAGPIDRAERFQCDFQALPELRGLDAARFGEGLWRVALGALKKFAIADLLAQGLSLNAQNAAQAASGSTLALWALLYGYTLRLFFDFSGYTDIAIGIGLLLGIRLPENFNRPYFTTNITAFWQSWHMTLSNWARFYVFSPLSRWFLVQKRRPSPAIIVLICQMSTMLVIGLWHGVALNFVIWGIWHAVGLYAHKQWTDRTRKWYRGLAGKPWQKRAWTAATWFVTFQYVALGWVWFALPDTPLAAQTLVRLLGMR